MEPGLSSGISAACVAKCLHREALICKIGGGRHKAVILIMFLGKLCGLCITFSALGWWYTGEYWQVANNRCGIKC